MKNEILKIVQAAKNKEYFNNSKIMFSVNHKDEIGPNHRGRLFIDTPITQFEDVLNKYNEITSFNITLNLENEIEVKPNFGNIYGDNWKVVNFIFYSKSKDHCRFEFDTLGARDSFRVSDKLRRPDMESKERYATIESNYCEYDKIDNTLDLMIELDQILDKQYSEKMAIINKLKMEL